VAEHLRRHQIRDDALDVPAGRAQREAEPSGFGVKIDQALDGAQCHQNGERLVELFDDVQWFAGQRVMPDCVKAQCPQQRHGFAIEVAQPGCRARGTIQKPGVHGFRFGVSAGLNASP